MSSARHWTLGLALLASLAAAVVHLLTRQQLESNSSNNDLPDFFITAPAWRQFDAEGRLARRLSARRLEHWRGEDPMLKEPRLLLSDRQGRRWQASARRAEIHAERGTLALHQEVRLTREPPAAGPVVSTEYLRVADDGDRVETDQAVVIESGSWHVRGSGLRAELGQHRMELLGNVRGIHD